MRDGFGKWPASQWLDLLETAISAIGAVKGGTEVEWAIGGGSALSLGLEHRIPDGVEIILDSAAVLNAVNPVRNAVTREALRDRGSSTASCERLDNRLRLTLQSRGWIEFATEASLVAGPLLECRILGISVLRERTADVVAKKVAFRGSRLSGLEVFDLACAFTLQPDETEAAARSPYVDDAAILRSRSRIALCRSLLEREILRTVNPTAAGSEVLGRSCELALEALDLMERTRTAGNAFGQAGSC